MAGWWCTDLLSRPTEFLGCTSLIFRVRLTPWQPMI
jgi:hypothetical protein